MTISDEGVHGAIVVTALVVLVAVLVATAVFASNAIRMVALSAVYVVGVCGFWLGYWVLSRTADQRREQLAEDS
ncbi:MAG: hypothetical protein ABEJ31_10010 [Haloarculaceae archaeon]